MFCFRQKEATHQETTECLHAVHEGNASQGGGRVYTQGECSYQPNTGPTGKWSPERSKFLF